MEFQTNGPTTRGFTVLNATKNDPFFSPRVPTVKSSLRWVQIRATAVPTPLYRKHRH